MTCSHFPPWFWHGYLTLPMVPRAVYTLSARDGLTFPEIAERLGIDIWTVELCLTHALLHLDWALQEEDP
jgi:DNA-directed RNA polymerase specialized sigma24 family protein